jgi:hypothetical protein
MKNVGIFMTIWNILQPFGKFYGKLVWFLVIWHIFPVLVCMDREKSGNPGFAQSQSKCMLLFFFGQLQLQRYIHTYVGTHLDVIKVKAFLFTYKLCNPTGIQTRDILICGGCDDR